MCLVKDTARKVSIDHMTGYKFVVREHELELGYSGYYTGAPMPKGVLLDAVGGVYAPSSQMPDYNVGFHFYGSLEDTKQALLLLDTSGREGVIVKIEAWDVGTLGKDGTSYDSQVNEIDVYVAGRIRIVEEVVQ